MSYRSIFFRFALAAFLYDAGISVVFGQENPTTAPLNITLPKDDFQYKATRSYVEEVPVRDMACSLLPTKHFET